MYSTIWTSQKGEGGKGKDQLFTSFTDFLRDLGLKFIKKKIQTMFLMYLSLTNQELNPSIILISEESSLPIHQFES